MGEVSSHNCGVSGRFMKLIPFLPAFALLWLLLGCGGAGASSTRVSLKVTPALAVLSLEGSQGFTYVLETSGATGVTWTCTGGSITQTGAYKAPKADGIFEITARSVEDPTVSATVVAVVGDSNKGTLDPADLSLGVGESWPVTASFTDVTDESCTWLTTGGEVTSTGAKAATLKAPDKTGTITLVARNSEDKAKFGKQKIQVSSISVAVSPDGNTVSPGGSKTFAAVVSGAKETGVTWEANGGSISPEGVWTAPGAPGTYTITARSKANPKFLGQVTVFVAS